MAKARINKAGQTEIKCPGCKTTHTLNTDPSTRPCWGFNGDFEKPTFTPSILERSGHYCGRDGMTAENCWCCNNGHKDMCYVCHSFVRDGMIQFLSDCSHELAGKTVPLEDFDATETP